MSTGEALLAILILLVAAKVAAEVAERVGVPTVLGEILAGILIGPSVLNIVQPSEVVHVLAELGVILLLVQVGMETDLVELRQVGPAALKVAITGVVLPFVLGYAAASAMGKSATTSLFVGAALTATSVGITARVLGDLRALATREARTVLGAAIADDVLGLIILTIVARIAESGSIDAVSVVTTCATALLFLVGVGTIGGWVAPRLFQMLHGRARSSGTLVAIALAFTLGFAELASLADLAPIVGAFLAGLVIGRSRPAHRISEELTPVSHIMVPVFFLSIGLDADLGKMLRPSVLGMAAVLLVIGVVTKVLAGWAAPRSADRYLIGLGMIPRGEVGLIFASLGKAAGVFDDDLYGAILLVVLGTTVIAPPLLRQRIRRMARANDDGAVAGTEVLAVALRTAARLDDEPPSTDTLDWIAKHAAACRWDRQATDLFFMLLRKPSPKVWRFLDTTGVLPAALPELSEALERRRRDPSQLDPLGALRWPMLSDLHDLLEHDLDLAVTFARLAHPERVLLAALAIDATDAGADMVGVAQSLVDRFDLEQTASRQIATLVTDSGMLGGAALRPGQLDDRHLREMASHVQDLETLRGLYLLDAAAADLHGRRSLDQLVEMLEPLVVRGDEVAARRQAAIALTESAAAAARIEVAPRAYVLAFEPDEIAHHADMVEPPPRKDELRVSSRVFGPGHHVVTVAGRDRPGFLAGVTRALASCGLDIERATIATWGDGVILDSFGVTGAAVPADELKVAIVEHLKREPTRSTEPMADEVTFDNAASPWFTTCIIAGSDRPGLLADLSAGFAAQRIVVHSARAVTDDARVRDEFSVTTATGRKLDDATADALADALRGETAQRRNTMETLRRRPRNSAPVRS